jgi:DNA-binding response OmpR family regulator
MEITARDIGRLIELGKKKAELEFKKSIYYDDSVELKSIENNWAELMSRAKSTGVELVYPHQRKLDALAKVLSGFSREEIKQAIKVREGKPYEILQERGQIIKFNYENRFEIAKLCLMAAKMKNEDKKALLDAIAAGCLAKPLKIESLDEDGKKRLARIMKRCGLGLAEFEKEFMPTQADGDEKEVKVEVANRTVWVNPKALTQIEENSKRINEVNSKIQLKNAERQIRIFGDEEEGQFSTLQRDYLGLLKQRDELLKNYWEEEKISVKV